MTSMLKATKGSVQLERESPMYVEISTHFFLLKKRLRKLKKIDSCPHIFIVTQSMPVDSTRIIVDDKEKWE